MKYGIVTLITFAMVLVGCTAIDPVVLSDAVVAAIKPALAQVQGLTPEQVDGITGAIRSGLAGNLKLPEGGFDWEAPLWAVGSMVATYFGVNIRRDMFRSARGEPTGKAPAAAKS